MGHWCKYEKESFYIHSETLEEGIVIYFPLSVHQTFPDWEMSWNMVQTLISSTMNLRNLFTHQCVKDRSAAAIYWPNSSTKLWKSRANRVHWTCLWFSPWRIHLFTVLTLFCSCFLGPLCGYSMSKLKLINVVLKKMITKHWHWKILQVRWNIKENTTSYIVASVELLAFGQPVTFVSPYLLIHKDSDQSKVFRPCYV